MTIREVIELLTFLFQKLMEYIGPLFEGKDEEAGDDTATEPEA